MRSLRLFVHETRLSAVFKARPSLLSGSFLVEPDVSPRVNPNRTDCFRVQRSVISIVNCLVRDSSSFVTSPRVIVNHTPSARVIIVFDNCLSYLHLIVYII